MTEQQAGQGGFSMGMFIGVRWVCVYTTEEAACRLNLSPRYVSQLCEQGELIATKEYGRWWVHKQRYKGVAIDDIPF